MVHGLRRAAEAVCLEPQTARPTRWRRRPAGAARRPPRRHSRWTWRRDTRLRGPVGAGLTESTRLCGGWARRHQPDAGRACVGLTRPGRAPRPTSRPLTPAECWRAVRGDPHLPRRQGLAHRRPPRPQPRRGRAHRRPAPGLRLAPRRAAVGHRPPGVRPQAAHRPRRGLRHGCASRAGCRATPRAPSRRTTSSRTATPPRRCRTPTGSPRRSPSPASRASAAVVAVIGDGALTGGMAWEALNNIAASDRPVVIVVNDNARSYAPTIGGLANHLATLRTTHGYERFLDLGQGRPRAHPGGRPPGLRHAARGQEGPQGHRRPAGHVRGPRPEVRRARRRPRHRGRRARAARAPSAYGAPVIVHVHHREGAAATPRPRQDEADRFHGGRRRSTRTPALPHHRSAPSWTGVFADEMVAVGARAAGRRGDHRGDAAAGRAWTSSPSASRPASSTSASPSSTPPPRRPGSPSAGCTRSSPSTPPSSTAPSTRS